MESVVLAGGGVKNAGLVRAIRANARCLPTTTDARGIPASHREAISFAVLGALCQDRIPITLPQVTGCDAGSPLAGSWVFP